MFRRPRYANLRRTRSIYRCWLTVCLLLCISQLVQAQLYPITASIAPTQTALTPYIHEWVRPGSMLGPFHATLLFNDLNNAPINASLRISIEAGGVSVRSNPNSPTIVNLIPGELLTLDQQTLASLLAPARLSNAQQGGLGNALPEGIYTICIEAYDLARGVPISNLACNVFQVQHFDVPEWRMLQPISELPSDAFTIGRTVVDLSAALTFSWTARHPPLLLAEYALQIYAMPKDHHLTYEQILRSEQPHFSTTTFTTQYVYTAMDPPLDTNRTYLAQLSVRDPMGQYNFVNNGVGPIATFQIMGRADDDNDAVPDPCLDPANRPLLSLDTFTSDSAYLSWQLSPSLVVSSLDVDVLKGSEWMLDRTLSVQELTYALATPGDGHHRFRLGMYCALTDTFVYSNTVSTAPFPEMAPDGCDTTLEIQINNRTPLGTLLQVGDSVVVGDFLMVIEAISSSGSSGEGYVITPLFNMFRPRLAVEFSELKVNEEYRMLGGVVNTVYEETDGSMLHFGDLSSIFAGQNSFDDLIYDRLTIPGKIIGIDISPDGNTILTIVDDLGNISTTAYPINTSAAPDYAEILEREDYLLEGDAFVKSKYPTSTSWTDSSGTEFGRVGDAVYHVSDRLDQALTANMGDLGTVTFSAHEDAHGGFDAPFEGANIGDYLTIGGNYPMSWKALRVGTSEPVYVDVYASQADTIFFETVSGYALNYNDASKIDLEVPCRGEGSQEAVYAVGQRISGKDTIRGTLGGVKIAGYPLRLMTLNVIPVNDTKIPINVEQLVRDLNRIYNPAIVSWQVKFLDAVNIDDLPVPLTASKGATNQYNAELRRIGRVLKDQDLIAEGTKKSPILTIVVVPELAGDYDGYMPLRRNLGFVGANKSFATADDDVHGFSRVIAHELGHGAFGLQHSWELYPSLDQGTTNNLMDYGNGIHLIKQQWDQIHDPLPVLGFLETTEGAGQLSERTLDYECITAEFAVFLHQEEINFYDLNGNPISLKDQGIPYAFVGKDEDEKYQGALAAFTSDHIIYGPQVTFIEKAPREYEPIYKGVFASFNIPGLSREIPIDQRSEHQRILFDEDGGIDVAGHQFGNVTKACPFQNRSGGQTLIADQNFSPAEIYLLLSENENLSAGQSKELWALIAYLEQLTLGKSVAYFYEYEKQSQNIQIPAEDDHADNEFYSALKETDIFSLEKFHTTFEVYSSEEGPQVQGVDLLISNVDLWEGIVPAYNYQAFDFSSFYLGSTDTYESCAQALDIIIDLYHYQIQATPEGYLSGNKDLLNKIEETSQDLINDPIGFPKKISTRQKILSFLALLGAYERYHYTVQDLIIRRKLTTFQLDYVKDQEAQQHAEPLTSFGYYQQQIAKYNDDFTLSLFLQYFEALNDLVEVVEIGEVGSRIIQALESNFKKFDFNAKFKSPLVKTKDDYLASIFSKLDDSKNWEQFVDDFGDDLDKLSWFDEDVGRVRAWDALFDYPVFRKNVDHLENAADYLKRTGKTKHDLVDDLEAYEGPKDTFLDELFDTPASGTYASNPSGVWNENPFVRGNAIEDVVNVAGVQTPPTFPKIDYYDPASQTATSVKSTDLFAKSYKDITRLEDLWKSYVDDISGQIFPISQGNFTIGDLLNPVSNRVLYVVTPYDTPLPGQQSIVNTIQNYANSKNVTVIFENIE